ncbi:MAG: hypothetical protein Q7O66_04500 [Dehalococcoidia bacterium]|nr:hypothetical protein [Dehalococcoidia bacterium]
MIGRLFDQWDTHRIDDPVAAGGGWADRQYAIPCFQLVYDYPEWLNEVFGYTTTDQDALHARWEWMDIAQQAFYDRWKELDPTKEPIAGNCGTGNMSGDEWVKYLPRTVKKYRLFGIHGYGYPTISANAQYQVLRYRDIMAGIRSVNPRARGMLTETGITHMVIPGYPDIGYTDIMTPDEYWSAPGNLSWLNDRLIEDKAFMEGGAVFQAGGDSVWTTFEILGTSIIDFMAAISPGTPAVDLGGGPVAQILAEQYAYLYQPWVSAGGMAEESFYFHLLGMGVLPVTLDVLDDMTRRTQAHVAEVAAMGARLPK